MTDEEKKAIEIIKFLQYKSRQENGTGMMTIYRIDDLANAIEILLNLIEKQQKEIEELKDINKKLEARKYMLNARTGEVTVIPIDNTYISKDKIKAKIEELEKEKNIPEEMDFKAFYRIKDLKNVEIGVLQSLLEKE